VPFGAHVCVFYETQQDLLDAVVTFFKAGLAAGETCAWAVSPPFDAAMAESALAGAIPDFADRLAAGQIEIIDGYGFYLHRDRFDLVRIMNNWSMRLDRALARGYEGLRVTGNAFWFDARLWQTFCDYEREIENSLAEKRMIVMCTYPLEKCGAAEIFDVVSAHNRSITRRRGRWVFFEMPATLSHEATPGTRINSIELLTLREKTVLDQLTKGYTSKQAARVLGISPRTVEFHRANIMRKLGARNLVDLVRIVVGKA
jgi:DNA-binding CsgD family transcriptional regulator